MKAAILLIFFILQGLWLPAQTTYSYAGHDPNADPSWFGQNHLFAYRDSAIQLNDTTHSGKGKAWLGYHAPLDSNITRSWGITLKLDFSPSPANFARFYLLGDHPDPARVTRGYFLQFGGISGNQDALQFYQILDGQNTLLMEGLAGNAGKPTLDLDLALHLLPNGQWELWTAYEAGDTLELEASTVVQPLPPNSPWLAFSCIYSPSRSRAFQIADLLFGALKENPSLPEVRAVRSLAPDSLLVKFHEPIQSPPDQGKISLEPPFARPAKAIRSDHDPRLLYLTWDPALKAGETYTLSIESVTGLSGRESPLQAITFEHFPPLPPEAGQLVINELLFNPPPGGSDYVELYNNSNTALNMRGLSLENHLGDKVSLPETTLDLEPGGFIVITPDPPALRKRFPKAGENALFTLDLPSLPDQEGKLYLWMDALLLDEMEYHEDMHSPWLSDPEGVALERINPNHLGADGENWHSASTEAGYGTPTLPNSQWFAPEASEKQLWLPRRVFSPDGDGREDFLSIQYQLPNPGAALSLQVYDAEGRLVRNLARHSLASVKGAFRWDGLGDEGQRVRLGIYFLVMELYGPNGHAKRFRDYCVVAGNLGDN